MDDNINTTTNLKIQNELNEFWQRLQKRTWWLAMCGTLTCTLLSPFLLFFAPDSKKEILFSNDIDMLLVILSIAIFFFLIGGLVIWSICIVCAENKYRKYEHELRSEYSLAILNCKQKGVPK